MLARLFKLAAARAIGGPGRSWLFTSGFLALFRFAKRQTGRRQVVDLSSTKPGDKIIIEHLDVTHKEQIKQIKAEKKSEKSRAKAEKKRAKTLEKELRRTRKG